MEFLLVILCLWLVLGVALPALLRWRVRRFMRQFAEQQGGGRGQQGGPGPQQGSRGRRKEGSVSLSAPASEKRVRGEVGDYVAFEDVTEKPEPTDAC